MTIGGTTIVTPTDNPCQFDPDWRGSVAMALFRNPNEPVYPEYQKYKFDPFIRRQISYLRSQNSPRLNKDQLACRLASLWAGGASVSDVRFRLDPLLLTPVSYEVIALDIMGDEADPFVIETYEKLYFNIRNNEGKLSKSCQLKQYFAMPGGEIDQDTPPEALWKMIAALMGYDTLMGVWLWKDAHGLKETSQEYVLDEMWRVAQSRLFMSMFANRVGHESMAKLLASISAQQKMLHEEKNSGDTGTELVRTLLEVLCKTNPVLINSTAKEVDLQQRVLQSVNARLEAEHAVEEYDLGDKGKLPEIEDTESDFEEQNTEENTGV